MYFEYIIQALVDLTIHALALEETTAKSCHVVLEIGYCEKIRINNVLLWVCRLHHIDGKNATNADYIKATVTTG